MAAVDWFGETEGDLKARAKLVAGVVAPHFATTPQILMKHGDAGPRVASGRAVFRTLMKRQFPGTPWKSLGEACGCPWTAARDAVLKIEREETQQRTGQATREMLERLELAVRDAMEVLGNADGN